MKVKSLLDLVELRLKSVEPTLDSPVPDRPVLQLFLTHAYYTLLEKEQWSWSVIYLKPTLQTTINVESYMLPRNFGENFIRGGADGHNWTVHISNGSTDSNLYYERPEVFFARATTGESTNQPLYYTIVSSGGRKFIYVNPKPDAAYTIWGAYHPVWDGEILEEDEDLAIPNHSVLLYGTLLQLEERMDWRQAQSAAVNDLYMTEARTMKPRMFPATSDLQGYVNDYDPMS